jgi:hypothetical protein
MKLMAGMILAVAVSVHTVVSWAMAVAPCGAVRFSVLLRGGSNLRGIAALITPAAVIRKTMHLEVAEAFRQSRQAALLMSLLWTYFTIAENITVWYGNATAELNVLEEKIYSGYAPFWGWSLQRRNPVCCCPLPAAPPDIGHRIITVVIGVARAL